MYAYIYIYCFITAGITFTCITIIQNLLAMSWVWRRYTGKPIQRLSQLVVRKSRSLQGADKELKLLLQPVWKRFSKTQTNKQTPTKNNSVFFSKSNILLIIPTNDLKNKHTHILTVMFGGLWGPAFVYKCISSAHNVMNVLILVPILVHIMLPEQLN